MRSQGSKELRILRLERKDLARAGIDPNLQPLHVVVAVPLVVAEGLDADEVLEPQALTVQEGSVDPEVMRVAVDIGDGLPEGDDLITQCEQEVLETVGLPIRFRQSLGVAQRRPRPIGLVPA